MPETKTLYERLKEAELVNLKFTESRTAVLKTMIELRDEDMLNRVDIDNCLQALPNLFPKILVPDYQRKIIEGYTHNSILDEALCKKRTIVQKVEELSKPHRGIQVFFPKRINEQHNHEVNELSELISATDDLKTRGVFCPDNSMTTATYCGAVLSLVAGSGLYAVSFDGKISPSDFSFMEVISSVGTGIGTMLTGLAFFGNGVSPLCHKQACYLDQKIAELYPSNKKSSFPAQYDFPRR